MQIIKDFKLLPNWARWIVDSGVAYVTPEVVIIESIESHKCFMRLAPGVLYDDDVIEEALEKFIEMKDLAEDYGVVAVVDTRGDEHVIIDKPHYEKWLNNDVYSIYLV